MSDENRNDGTTPAGTSANRRQGLQASKTPPPSGLRPPASPLEIGRRKIRLPVVIGKVTAAD